MRDTLNADLQAALDGLGEAFREVVWLRDVDELTYQEIADVLEIPIGTVMSRLSRGRKQLVRGPDEADRHKADGRRTMDCREVEEKLAAYVDGAANAGMPPRSPRTSRRATRAAQLAARAERRAHGAEGARRAAVADRAAGTAHAHHRQQLAQIETRQEPMLGVDRTPVGVRRGGDRSC